MDTNAPLPGDTPAAPKDTQPEKYIRTFAGDIETLRGGGSPDLTPLDESHATVAERLVAPSPVPPPAPPAPEPPPVETPAPPEKPEPSPTPLETYAGDFMARVKDTHASPMTVLAAEQDAAQGAPRAEPPEQPRSSTIPYIIGGVVLIIVGVASAYVAHLYYAQTNAPVVLAPTVSAPIFVDDRHEIVGSGVALTQAIVKSVAAPIVSGSIRLLYTASSTDSGSIFSALGTSAPNVAS
ncbi:MAG: hypothetical protein B7W98_01890, partial [Parcubacteria group bacterium 20-58-5]